MSARSSPPSAHGGRLLEASDDRVVFVRCAHLAPTLVPIVGALGILVLPILAMPLLASHHGRIAALVGILLPCLLSAWAWSMLPRMALAWSPLRPLRGRLTVERLPGDAYRRAASCRTTIGRRQFGPEGRHGLFQLRVYDELPVPGTIPLSERASEGNAELPEGIRRILVANVLVVGDQATIVSHGSAPFFDAWRFPPQYVAAAVAIGHPGDGARAQTYVKNSMVPLVEALARILSLPSKAAPNVPRVVWQDKFSGNLAANVAFANLIPRGLAFLYMGAYLPASGAGLVRGGIEVGVLMIALEAGLYVSSLRKSYLQPLTLWFTRFMDDYTTAD